jgi:CRP/FNR family transcriptional regulator
MGRDEFDVLRYLTEAGKGRQKERFGVGQTIYSLGDPARWLFYVISGSIRISVVTNDAKAVGMMIVTPTQFFGEEILDGEILGGQKRRKNTAAAITVCDVMKLDPREFMALKNANPELQRGWEAFLVRRVVQHQESYRGMVTNDARQRLARVLFSLAPGIPEDTKTPKTPGGLKGGRIFPKPTHEDLAELSGIGSRPRVSTFMKQFERAGWIDDKNGAYIVYPSLVECFSMKGTKGERK